MALGALLRLAFRSELDQSSYPEIRSFSVDRKGRTRLFLTLGTRDGYSGRKLVEMLKRKCGLRDKHIDDVRLFENYSLVSVPFSDAESVVSRLNASGGRRRIARIDREDAAAGAKPEPGESRPEKRSRRDAAEVAEEESRSEKNRPEEETPKESRPEKRGRKRAANDWSVPPAGGNEAFDWEAFQRFAEAAAWEKPRRGGTRNVRRGARPVTTGRQAAPKRLAAKGRKR